MEAARFRSSTRQDAPGPTIGRRDDRPGATRHRPRWNSKATVPPGPQATPTVVPVKTGGPERNYTLILRLLTESLPTLHNARRTSSPARR